MFCDSEGAIDGAVDDIGAATVSMFDAVCVVGVDGPSVAGEVDETAAAAAAAYRIGGNVAGGRGAGGSPAFSMLDIGCCAKLGFGGGFAEVSYYFGHGCDAKKDLLSVATEASGHCRSDGNVRVARNSLRNCNPTPGFF